MCHSDNKYFFQCLQTECNNYYDISLINVGLKNLIKDHD